VKLNVTYSNILTLRSDNSTNLSKLMIISMCKNGIQNLEPRIFCSSKELRTLNLSENEIVSINSESFRCLEKLTFLYLNSNKIPYIDTTLFKNNGELNVLDLRNNKIKTVRCDTFQNNPLLSLFLVENNPMDLYLASLNCLHMPFNVLDIEFCKLDRPFLISYQSIPHLQELKQDSTKGVSVTELSPQSKVLDLFNIIKFKMEKINYNSLDGYVNNNSTLDAVTTLSDIPVLCYCGKKSVWFWCCTECMKHVGLAQMYLTLKCSEARGTGSDVSDLEMYEAREELVHNLTDVAGPQSAHETHTVTLYVFVPITVLIAITIIIVVVLRARHKCKKAREEIGSSSAENSFIFQNLLTEDNVCD
jgi:hypothetical protein